MFKKTMYWAISSEASLETKMNVQRLLKVSKLCQIMGLPSGTRGTTKMTDKIQVNRSNKHAKIEARDKELLIEKTKTLHAQGFSQVEISKILGISRNTLRRWNDELNFVSLLSPGEAGKRKSKVYQYNENIFENIDDPNKAYVLGFAMGDGYIVNKGSSKRFLITLAISDRQIIDDIASYFNLESLVKIRKAIYANEQDKIQLIVNSTKMCNDLAKYGILPGKTGYEIFTDLNSTEYQWAFLRGFFDADGSIRKYLRKDIRPRKNEELNNKKTHTKTKFSLTGNKQMMVQIKSFLESEGFKLPPKTIFEKQGCVSFEFSSMETIRKVALKIISLNYWHPIPKT